MQTVTNAMISLTSVTLRKLGVELEREGDTAKVSFQGVTTEVENTNEAIRDHLINTLGAKFQGAMAETTDNVKVT